MLDDDGRRRLWELEGQCERGVEVEQVVVGQLLALQHLGEAERRPLGRLEGTVEGAPLVRVLAVAQLLDFLEGDAEFGREGLAGALSQVAGDGGVVGGGMGERLAHQPGRVSARVGPCRSSSRTAG